MMIQVLAASVLVVDDDPTFRRLARLLLAAHGLAVVAEAGSLADALTAAQRLRPTAALVDVELPDGDGFTLARELSGMPWTPRVVVTSVHSSGGYPAEAKRNGAEAFVQKAELPTAPLLKWLTAE
jgi:DNA-binding NarL/FixJ family response regulator